MSMLTRRFDDLPLRRKFAVLTLFLSVGVVVLCALAAHSSYQEMMRAERASLEQRVKAALSLVEHYHAQAREGLLDESDAKRQALAALEQLRSRDGTDYVWVVQDGRAVRRGIEAGPVTGDEREVRSGLSGGELLVLEPPPDLADGTRVVTGSI